MKVKRFILMLLVTLGSVTGAWADEVEFSYWYSVGVSWGDSDLGDLGARIMQEIRTYRNKSNKYFKVVLSNDAGYYTISNWINWMMNMSFGEGWATASSFTVTNLDVDHVTIQEILVNEETSFSYPNGQLSATITLSSDGPTVVKGIKIIFTSSHEHSIEWKHDGNAHWQECVGDGVCTLNDSRFNQGNHSYSDDRNQGVAYYTCATCGYVNEQRKHQHVPAYSWSSDANQHWHACTETVGVCDANGKLDLANHSYGNDMYGEDATAYYTCATCGYVNNTRKTQYEALDFLTMKAVGGNVNIGMTKTGSPADYDLQYSLDRAHWASLAMSATNDNIVEIVSGKTCYFRHGTATAIDRISTNGENYWTFTMSGTGTIEAGGNIMSLLDATVQRNTIGSSFAFTNLFKGCGKLTKAPKLPATSTSERCYMGMFEETGITQAPALPAATVPKGAYQNMFKNCLNLATAPELVATKVIYAGYQDMFNGCKKITAVTLKNNITTIEGTAFKNWLVGTAYEAEGIITAPDALVGQSEIMNNMPGNWMFKQIKDYTTEVSNALVGTTETVQDFGKDYIEQIRNATSNASALSLRDEALSYIELLKEYPPAEQFRQPTGAGMRLKVTMKDGKVYEFKTKDIKSTKFSDPTDAGMSLRVTMNGGKAYEFKTTDIESTEFYCATE